MITENLYESNAYLKEFSAAVLSCEAGEGGWLVELDRTAFYPEGGGQPCDLGPWAAPGCWTCRSGTARCSTP